jgi:hypothetical protein
VTYHVKQDLWVSGALWNWFRLGATGSDKVCRYRIMSPSALTIASYCSSTLPVAMIESLGKNLASWLAGWWVGVGQRQLGSGYMMVKVAGSFVRHDSCLRIVTTLFTVDTALFGSCPFCFTLDVESRALKKLSLLMQTWKGK